MRICDRFATILTILVGLLSVFGAPAFATPESAEADKLAIERLHRQTLEATLSGNADELVKLWADDGVRLTAGSPAAVGKTAIYDSAKRWQMKNPEWRTLYYKPEIKDLQIAGDWAVEWGYFDTSHKEFANATPVALRGTFLRVLKRQRDGSWKFARVMIIESPN